jgi:hypothetical protein
MVTKRYSPPVLSATTEALAACFHYKNDLASFLASCGVPADLLVRHQLSQGGPPKRIALRAIIAELTHSPLIGTPILHTAIDALLGEDLDFPRLARLEDGSEKVRFARAAIARLRDVSNGELAKDREATKRTFAIEHARKEASDVQRRNEMLKDLHDKFTTMFVSKDEQRRGRDFDLLLRDLFEYFDLASRRPYRPSGEEVDGAIVLDGLHLMVEAKWLKAPVETSDIAVFRQKIEDKLKTTIGVFVSMSGFSTNAVDKARNARSMILIDGSEVMPVLEGQVDLVELLRRKLRRAHETGDPLFKAFS